MKTKILVVSDSHGNREKLEKIIRNESGFDYLIHCGDGADDLFQVTIPDDKRIIRVCGNMDSGMDYNISEMEFDTINEYNFMITHGNRQKVHNDYIEIIEEGRLNNADVVLFGHTHRQYLSGENPILFNPGAVIYGYYGIIIINKNIEFFHRKM